MLRKIPACFWKKQNVKKYLPIKTEKHTIFWNLLESSDTLSPKEWLILTKNMSLETWNMKTKKLSKLAAVFWTKQWRNQEDPQHGPNWKSKSGCMSKLGTWVWIENTVRNVQIRSTLCKVPGMVHSKMVSPVWYRILMQSLMLM